MTNHLNRNKIINLVPIKPSTQIQVSIDKELYRETVNSADYKASREILQDTSKNVAILGLNGQQFHISAMNVMLDGEYRLKSEFEKAVVADAVRQAARKQHPERKQIEVDVSWGAGNEEVGYFEYQASIWWNYRRQYEQCFCYVRY